MFRQRAEQAERQCGLKPGYWRAVGPDPMDLEPGTFYAIGIDSGAVRLRVPEVPALPPASAQRPNDVPMASGTSPIIMPGRRPDTISGDADAISDATVDAVLRAFHAGTGLTASIRSVTGLRPGGRAYEDIRAAVEAALRSGR